MTEDPRFRNETFEGGSIEAFASGYGNLLSRAIASVDPAALNAALQLIEGAAASGRRIYAIGNGGSAAIADHLCCDWTKGTHVRGKPAIAATSLVSNVALYSAIANDYGFEQVFVSQVEFFGQPGDVLVAISSSGNSPNIVMAVEAAKARGMKTIGLSGFAGGKLRDAADVALYTAASNYGVVEDAHQALMHILAQYIAKRRDAAARP